METLAERGRYDPELYLDDLVAFMRNPDSHDDTYVEEWLRGFFHRRALGHALRDCGVPEKHIGGLCGPVALLLHHHDDPELARAVAHEHRELTHKGPAMAAALDAVADVLLPVLAGTPLPEAIAKAQQNRDGRFLKKISTSWADRDDFEVIGRILSPACYVRDAVPAVFYLANKYANRPEEGLVANTMVGGDNCYRGAVLGALLGAFAGTEAWPVRWREGLCFRPSLQL
jgi:ADP-ribosylglycohydrolase